MTDAFGRGGGGCRRHCFFIKRGGFEKIVTQASKCTQKTFARKGIEGLPAIVRSVVGAVLSFLGKAVGFVAEHA